MRLRRVAGHFSTMHPLAALPGKNSRFALRQFSRRALRCGGMVPEKISGSPLPKTHFHNRGEKKERKRNMAIEERTISMLVNNQPGVLSRIAGVFSSRGYNIRSLCVAETTNPEVSRITLTSRAESDFTEKIKKQLDKLVDVISVTDFTGAPSVQRELMLISLRLTVENRQEILRAIDLFGCRVVAMSEDYLIMEITANKDKTAAILRYFEPFGVEEMNRTGAIAVFRQKREG
jgi:acetolactate synthase I/III small subunit